MNNKVTDQERERIAKLLAQKKGVREVAKLVRRNKSVVYEVARSLGGGRKAN